MMCHPFSKPRNDRKRTGIQPYLPYFFPIQTWTFSFHYHRGWFFKRLHISLHPSHSVFIVTFHRTYPRTSTSSRTRAPNLKVIPNRGFCWLGASTGSTDSWTNSAVEAAPSRWPKPVGIKRSDFSGSQYSNRSQRANAHQHECIVSFEACFHSTISKPVLCRTFKCRSRSN